MPITNTTPILTKRERAKTTGRYRSRRFERTITLALEDAGIAIPYKQFETALHAAMGAVDHLPWLRNAKRNMYEKERNVTGSADGFENVAYAVAGAAIGIMSERGIRDNTDRRAVMGIMLDSVSVIVEKPMRKQWDQPAGWREPTYFSELEDDGDVDNIVLRPPATETEINGTFDDPRLQAIWDAADGRERQMLRDVAAGVPVTQASLNTGYSATIASDKLRVQLPRRAGLTEGRQPVAQCKNGHPMSGDNLLVTGGRRVCRTCARDRSRRHYERTKT